MNFSESVEPISIWVEVESGNNQNWTSSLPLWMTQSWWSEFVWFELIKDQEWSRTRAARGARVWRKSRWKGSRVATQANLRTRWVRWVALAGSSSSHLLQAVAATIPRWLTPMLMPRGPTRATTPLITVTTEEEEEGGRGTKATTREGRLTTRPTTRAHPTTRSGEVNPIWSFHRVRHPRDQITRRAHTGSATQTTRGLATMWSTELSWSDPRLTHSSHSLRLTGLRPTCTTSLSPKSQKCQNEGRSGIQTSLKNRCQLTPYFSGTRKHR